MNFIFTLAAFNDAKKLIEDSMKKHEAFQFLVKRRSANLERKVSRKEHYDKMLDNTLSKESSETVCVEIETLRLSPPRVNEEPNPADMNMSPASKRRGESYFIILSPKYNCKCLLTSIELLRITIMK